MIQNEKGAAIGENNPAQRLSGARTPDKQPNEPSLPQSLTGENSDLVTLGRIVAQLYQEVTGLRGRVAELENELGDAHYALLCYGERLRLVETRQSVVSVGL